MPGYIVPTQTKNGKVFIQYETSTRTKANKYIRINNKAAKEVSLHLSPNQKTHVPRPDKFGKLNKKSYRTPLTIHRVTKSKVFESNPTQ